MSSPSEGALVRGVGGILASLFLVPFIANGAGGFAMVVAPPALLLVLCNATQSTLAELLRGALLYGSGVAAAFVQMQVAVAWRRHAVSIEKRLIWEATHDPLTGIHNRAWLTQEAAQAFATARRYRMEPVFAMLDIDHFKRVNDTYGHQAGDDVLKAVAQAAQGALRETDRFGRLGGEEFFCILPLAPAGTAMHCAERIRKAVEALAVPADGQLVHVTISIGLARMADGQAGWEDLLKRADDALYVAKQSGRNCIRSA